MNNELVVKLIVDHLDQMSLYRISKINKSLIPPFLSKFTLERINNIQSQKPPNPYDCGKQNLIISANQYSPFNYVVNHILEGACEGGHHELIDLMIEKGADHCNEGLSFACLGGNFEIVELMIEKGAYYWNKGLSYACYGGNMEIVKLMIEKGKVLMIGILHYILHYIMHVTEEIWKSSN